MRVPNVNLTPTLIGLLVALFGPFALAAVAARLDLYDRLWFNLLGELLLWALLATVLTIMRGWEKRPLAAIGLGRLRLGNILRGLGLAAAFLFLTPIFIRLLKHAGIETSYQAGIDNLSKLPVWFLLLAAVSAGIVEEVLYRGYAIAALTDLTKHRWLAAIISVVVFTLVHLPSWGFGPIPIFLISSSLVTAFFLLTNDLFACILAHIIVDAVGLIALTRPHA